MRRVALGATAVAMAAAALLFWPTDARAVRQTLAAAADAASVPAREGDFQRVARAASLAKRLARDAVVQAGPDGPTIHGRDTIVGLAALLRTAGPVTVTLDVVDLTVDAAAGRANVIAVVHVSGIAPGELESVDAAELTLELTKIDGAWLIARVSRVPVLRR